MNAALTQVEEVKRTPHLIQSVDWAKYDLQCWLQQFGYWLGTSNTHFSSGGSPLVAAIKKAKLKLKKKQVASLIAHYIIDEEFVERAKTRPPVCEITDNEARAVQKLVLDVINGTDSEVMLDWMGAIVSRYFRQCSWSDMERPDRTVMDAKFDVRCGLAVLHGKYPFIEMNKKCA